MKICPPTVLKPTFQQINHQQRSCRTNGQIESKHYNILACLAQWPLSVCSLVLPRVATWGGCLTGTGGLHSGSLSSAPALVVGQRSKDALGNPISRSVCIRHSRQTTARDGSSVAFGGSMIRSFLNHSRPAGVRNILFYELGVKK